MVERQEIPYYTSILFIYRGSKCKVTANAQAEDIGKQMRLTINNLLMATKFIQRNIYETNIKKYSPEWKVTVRPV